MKVKDSDSAGRHPVLIDFSSRSKFFLRPVFLFRTTPFDLNRFVVNMTLRNEQGYLFHCGFYMVDCMFVTMWRYCLRNVYCQNCPTP